MKRRRVTAIDGLEEALAAADGTAQPWNEVYEHPQRAQTAVDLEERFQTALRLEQQVLDNGGLHHGGPAECGLEKAALDRYVQACGLDVDIGVGSLIIALNGIPGVTTISSCSSAHAGAHEEEALVAFVAPDSIAKRIGVSIGDENFRESREDVIKLRGGVRRIFQSYIVFSAAVTPTGLPNAETRVRELIVAAKKLRKISDSSEMATLQNIVRQDGNLSNKSCHQSSNTLDLLVPKRKPELWRPLLEFKSRVTQLQAEYRASGSAAVQAPAILLCGIFNADHVAAVREELKVGLKGLQPIETEDACVMVLPIRTINGECANIEALPRLVDLVATLGSLRVRRLLRKVTCCSLLARRPHMSVIAVPPGGHWLPQCVAGGGGSLDELSFAFFLTEDWWNVTAGGVLEVFGAATPNIGSTGRSFVARPGSMLVHKAGLCTAATRVVSECAPLLAVHGIYSRKRYRDRDAAITINQVDEAQASVLPCERIFVDEDRRELSRYVSIECLDDVSMSRIKIRFMSKSIVTLKNFLSAEHAAKLAALLGKLDSQELVTLEGLSSSNGCVGGDEWTLIGPVSLRRCLSFTPGVGGCHGTNRKRKKPTTMSAASAALAELVELFAGKSFLQYVEALTGLRRKVAAGNVARVTMRRYRPGLDYCRPTFDPFPCLDVVLCLGADLESPRHRVLDDGPAGGADGYIEMADLPSGRCGSSATNPKFAAAGPFGLLGGARALGGDAPPTPLLRLPAVGNALRLVLRDSKTAHYVETISNTAARSRWEVRLCLPTEQLPDDDEDSEDGNQEEEEDEEADEETANASSEERTGAEAEIDLVDQMPHTNLS